MKATLYDITGKKKGEVSMPAFFDMPVREDIASKFAEAAKYWQPHSTYDEAGKRHSASGTISHKRHDWKGQYGKGIARTPRKNMSRRGSQFNWIGAEVSNTRGGRSIHHPTVEMPILKINRKEQVVALHSALVATAHTKYIQQRYARLAKKVMHAPFVVESKLDNIKFKDLKAMLTNIFGESIDLVFKRKVVRAGRGKMRGRMYKSNAGLLLIVASNERVKATGIDMARAKDLNIVDLWPLGRIVLYTEKALQELGEKK